MDINNLVTVIGSIIVAVLGASGIGFFIYKRGKSTQKNKTGDNTQINQNIGHGNNNIQAGGNVDIKTKDWK